MNVPSLHQQRTLYHQSLIHPAGTFFSFLKRGESGFILMMTLFMMMICSILVLSSMQKLLFTFQIQNQLKLKHQAMRALKEVSDTLQIALPTLPKSCVYQGVNPSLIQTDWFNHHGCNMVQADTVYHYAIIDLDVFPCVLINTKAGQQSSHHWWLLMQSQRLPGVIVCTRIATPELHNLCPANLSMTVVKEYPLSQFLLTSR